MKKIFYLVIFILVFTVSNCYARVNDGIIYEQWWQESQVDVFAKDTTYERYDYNGIYIKSSINDDVYYCIQPESYMQNIGDGFSNTHEIFEENTDILNIARISNDTLKRISLLAYYGYNYKNHTDKKWYGVTQVMIWRSIRGDVKWEFKDSRYGSVNKNLYLDMVNELNNLVENHDIIPSFNNKTIRAIKNEKIILHDDNEVLDNFSVLNNEYADFEIKGNDLIIYPKQSGKINISLEREEVNNNFALFASNKYQNLITRGDVPFIDTSFDIDILDHEIYGLLSIYKQKGADFEEYLSENDAVFEIYDENNNLITSLVTDHNGFASTSLKYGKYLIKQVKGDENYSFIADVEINIDEEKEYIYNFINNRKSKLVLYKNDVNSNNYLSGACFNLYKDDNTLIYSGITNSFGKFEVYDLEIGRYYIKETCAPKYYEINSELLFFDVDSYGKEIKLTFYDNKIIGSLEVYKTDGVSNLPLEGAVFEIYNSLDELVYSGTTNVDGKILLNNIEAGLYYLKEIKSPDGYEINNELIEFEIEDKVLVHLLVSNFKIDNPKTSDNILGYIILFLIGLFAAFSFISAVVIKKELK